MKSARLFPAILLALAALALASVACSFATNGLKTDNLRITVTLKENEINQLLANSNNTHENDGDQLLKTVDRIEMHDGFIRVFGTYEKPDGSDADGSYDAALAAEDGKLKAQITAVDIEGATLESERVKKVNSKLAEALSRSARESGDEVQFESVKITNDAMTMVINAHWNQK